MREETVQFETLISSVTTRLERAGGIPLPDAILYMHAIKNFLASCAACGVAEDLRVAMERAGVGDMAEALLPLVR
jgi:hypothetical protein